MARMGAEREGQPAAPDAEAQALHDLRLRLAEAEAELSPAVREVRRLQDLVGEQSRELAELTRMAEAQRQELQRLRAQLMQPGQMQWAAIRDERDALAAEVQALRASTSWRITAPLRAVSALLRRGAR
ncbi:MAG: hypothetical protein ACK4KW_07130 [Gemmobacter sp.]